MKQPSKKEKERLEKEFQKACKNGFETDEGIIYPENCEMGTLYSPEECKRLGIL